MKIKLLIFLIVAFTLQSCQNKKLKIEKLKDEKIGSQLFSVISNVHLKPSDLNTIEEPTLILHGFSFSENSNIGYIIIERIPIEPANVGDKIKIYNQVKNLKIIGIAWKNNYKKKSIGVEPPKWK